MVKLDLYTINGTKKAGGLALPKEFDEKENLKLIAQALRVYGDNTHPGMAKAQTRAEVNRTGKKLYKQKGTGGARHGSRKAPIFVGGGVAHGPRPLRRVLTLPTKLKRKALVYSLALKAKDNEIIAVEGIEKVKKTKEVAQFLNKVSGNKLGRISLILKDTTGTAARFIRNIKDVEVYFYKDLNAYNVYFGGFLVLDSGIFEKQVTKVNKTPEVEKEVVTEKKVLAKKTLVKGKSK